MDRCIATGVNVTQNCSKKIVAQNLKEGKEKG
jgi:hypothetical protein